MTYLIIGLVLTTGGALLLLWAEIGTRREWQRANRRLLMNAYQFDAIRDDIGRDRSIRLMRAGADTFNERHGGAR